CASNRCRAWTCARGWFGRRSTFASGRGQATIMRRKNIEDNFKKCLDRAANARSRAEEATDPARKAEYFRLESNWIRLARSYDFAKRLKSSWHKPVSANIIALYS